MTLYRTYSHYLNMSPWERYSVPFIGKTFQGLDQYGDYQRMYNDYMRHVGRPIKYPFVRDYRTHGSAAMSSALTNALSFGMKTTRSVLDL